MSISCAKIMVGRLREFRCLVVEKVERVEKVEEVERV
jgi:hypothetical protein